jgi:hypothetical protein
MAEKATLSATVSASGDFRKSGYTFVYTYTQPPLSWLQRRGAKWPEHNSSIHWHQVLHDGQPDVQATKTYPCIHLAVQWLMRLDADLLLQKPLFDLKQVHVGFVVDKVANGTSFSRSISVFSC